MGAALEALGGHAPRGEKAMTVKVHNAKFVKKDGTLRAMRFVVVGSLTPEERAAMGVPPPSERPAKTPPGSILVWDLDAEGFRIFNPDTAVEGWP